MNVLNKNYSKWATKADERKNFSRSASKFCKEHSEAFADSLKNISTAVVLHHYYILTFILCAMIVLNNLSLKSFEKIYYYEFTPTLILILIPPLCVRVWPKLSGYIGRNSNHILDLILFSWLIGLCIQVGIGTKLLHFKANGGPVQITLTCSGLLPFHPKFRHVLLRNTIFTFCAALTIYWINPEYFAQSRSQYIMGFVLASSIAYYIRSIEKGRFFATYLHQSRNEHYFNEMKKSFYPHQRWMMKNKLSLEETMTVHSSSGFVYEVDIIGSSQYEEKEFTELKQKAFSLIYEHMMKDYTWEHKLGSRPKCSIKKLKEMGDGYIATIGYPFEFPQGSSMEDFAFDHSHEVVGIWDKVFKNKGYNAKLAIVVAKDTLKGFWTSPPDMLYDIEQSGIVKTARISQLRRVLHEKIPGLIESHILIIEKDILSSLSAENQSDFFKVELKSHGLQVRGLPETKSLYIKAIQQTDKQDEQIAAS